ncbi:DUF1223 domain-containing protein [Shimia sp.]|uniref:DUF1223 domain-containing protein n=1 Tax=Shimia sp. TaxID=1954381 RepID=UPI003298C357
MAFNTLNPYKRFEKHFTKTGRHMIRIFGTLATLWLILTGAAVAQDRPVVVELYTSQGCSSCPPADAYFLEKLSKRDDVIALALHVDYWDYIGWKDNFADPAYTARQQSYARAAGHRSVYTPQMIVNGQDHVVGTKPDKLEKLIRSHKAQSGDVDLTIERRGNRVAISARSAVTTPMIVHLVRYTPQESVSIKRGENAGKVLTYANIVDDWQTIGNWNGRSPLKMDARAKEDAPAVILIQRADGGPILAAAKID